MSFIFPSFFLIFHRISHLLLHDIICPQLEEKSVNDSKALANFVSFVPFYKYKHLCPSLISYLTFLIY